MYDLFLQIILMTSLGVIIYMVAITIPRVSEPEEASLENDGLGKTKIGAAHILDKVDNKLIAIKDKTLRRLKVFIMKADNFVSDRLNNNKDKI